MTQTSRHLTVAISRYYTQVTAAWSDKYGDGTSLEHDPPGSE